MSNWIKNAGVGEWFCAFFFVFFASVSCFCTTQSLCLSLGFEGWPLFVIVFLVTLGIYCVTSFFLVRIWNYNNDKYRIAHGITDVMQRNWTIGGVVMVIFLWIIFSFPTNTHDLVFQKKANEVARQELSNQLSIFQKAASTTTEDVSIRYSNLRKELDSIVNYLQGEFDREIKDDKNPGLGPKAYEDLAEIEEACIGERGKGFHHTTQKDRSDGEKKRILDYYNPQIVQLKEEGMKRLDFREAEELKLYAEKRDALNNRINQISSLHSQLEKEKSVWNRSSMSPTELIEKAKKLIQKGYNDPDYRTSILDNVVVLKSKEIVDDTKKYEYSNVKSYNYYSIDRLYNAREVWQDFLTKRLPAGFDMLTWILLSLIIDIVAFVFSLRAFRSK
jgi:hypothetical protein